MNMCLCENHVFDYVNKCGDMYVAMCVLWRYLYNCNDGDEMRMMW